MRQQQLIGYVLHARPYQEKRSIYQLFSSEFGMVHGVGVRGLPCFVPMTLFATGKNSLKTFKQIQPMPNISLIPIQGQLQYALLYMNEVLIRLLAVESPCDKLWQSYHTEVLQLQEYQMSSHGLLDMVKQALRRFERALFEEMGVSIDFCYDGLGVPIAPKMYYRFVPEMGFIPNQSILVNQANDEGKKVSRITYLGADLLQMANAKIDKNLYVVHLSAFGQIQRDVMDYLLEYKPLHSRKLWRQSMQYQSI